MHEYRFLAHTTENDENLVRVLAHPRIPQSIIEVYVIRYYSHVAS
jgi:hypothetical protein